MKKPKYLRWILAVEAVGALSGFLSRNDMKMVHVRFTHESRFVW